MPVGFLAAVTKGQAGASSRGGGARRRGSAGFTDDGRPVADAGLMRRALQYSAVTGVRLAQHCEEPTLSRGGQRRGRRSPRSSASSPTRPSPRAPWSRATWRSRPTSGGPCTCCTSRRGSRSMRWAPRAPPASKPRGRSRRTISASPTKRSTPLDPNVKMNPPLRAEATAPTLVDGLRDGTVGCRTDTHRSRADEKDAPFEDRPVRRDPAPDRLRSPQHLPRPARCAAARDRARAPLGRRGAGVRARAAACRGRCARRLVASRPRRRRAASEGDFRFTLDDSWLLGQVLQRRTFRLTIAAGRSGARLCL